MTATVKLKGVHKYMKYPEDCPNDDEGCDDHDCMLHHIDDEPLRVSRWMDPESPISHWSIPRRDEDFEDDPTDEPVVVELPIVAAARLIADWPGGVWDRSEGNWSTIDYQYGVEHDLTLFVDGPDCVWAVVEVMERWRAEQLASLRERATA